MNEIWVLEVSDSRHGSSLHGIYSTEDIARRHVRLAFKEYARCYGGSPAFSGGLDQIWFGENGASVHLSSHEVIETLP